MSEWKTYTIDEIGEVISGGTPSSSVQEYWDGDIVWITPFDLSKIKYGKIRTSSRKITEKGLNNSSANIIPQNNIVISSRAPIGYCAVSTSDYCTNQGCKSIRLKIGFDSVFQYYNLIFNINKIKQKGEGTTFAEISKNALEKIKLTCPPLPQQRKIARILNTVDNIIEKTEAAIAKYKVIKQGMMHDLCNRGIDVNTGKLRPAFHDAPELYKKSDLGMIPKEWRIYSLAEVSSGGGLKNGYFKKPAYVGRGFKLINVTDLYQPFGIDITLPNVERVYAEPADYVKYNVQIGDIFFTRSSLVLEGIAQCNIALALPEQAVYECHVMRLRPNRTIVNPVYLSAYCSSQVARKFFISIAKQVTMATISQPDVERLVVPMPLDIKEQERISVRLLSNEKIVQQEENTLRKLKSIKKGLMQDLLTGKKGVTPDPEDFDSEQRTVNSEQRTTNSEQRTTNSE